MKKVKDVEKVLYKNDSISLVRINDQLHLYSDVVCYNEIFEILIYGIEKNITDEEFWKIRLTATDINQAKTINLIWFLSGAEKVWHDENRIYTLEWLDMLDVFHTHLGDKIRKILKQTTLKEIKQRMLSRIAIEDFIEVAMQENLLNDTLL
jgi:hypothetical protein